MKGSTIPYGKVQESEQVPVEDISKEEEHGRLHFSGVGPVKKEEKEKYNREVE